VATPALLTTASASWQALGVTVQVVVADPEALEVARLALVEELRALDLACSRFRADSEVVALGEAGGLPVTVSPLLREAVLVALDAAARTDGLLDPTLGATLVALGYDRDLSLLTPAGPVPAPSSPVPVQVQRAASWRDVSVGPDTVAVPAGVLLDLGATAKAFGADRAAARIADLVGCGVLVSLGGDVAVAGPAPADGWPVRVQDRPGDLGALPVGPHQTVAVRSGGLATSSTDVRRWQHAGRVMHHILDPRTLAPAVSPWRTITVAAASCVEANTLSTAGVIRGEAALGWLRGLGAPARLVTHAGGVFTVNGWPEEVAA
jgi:thiamine biosynthesis lipoprotein